MTMPMDYSMCCQSVTVYRKTPTGILRMVLPDCFLQWQEEVSYGRLGRELERKFLLIQPGESQLVFPGDRVLEGVGPEIAETQWSAFVPELVTGLAEVAYAKVYHWQGTFCHTEAGRK